MRTELERRYRFEGSWNDRVLSDMLARFTGPVLLIHDRDDKEIPFENLHALSARCRHAKKVATSGFGHCRILRSPGSREPIIDFVECDEQARARPMARDSDGRDV